MKHEKRKIRFSIYKAKDGFRWHCHASNGKITAESGEAYKQRVSARRSLASFCDHILSGNWQVGEE